MIDDDDTPIPYAVCGAYSVRHLAQVGVTCELPREHTERWHASRYRDGLAEWSDGAGKPAHTSPDLPRLYVTFGQRYAYEPHPTLDGFVHPDGWIEVTGLTLDQARSHLFEVTGGAHAFDYDAERFDNSRVFYPLGCTLELDAIRRDDDRDSRRPHRWRAVEPS